MRKLTLTVFAAFALVLSLRAQTAFFDDFQTFDTPSVWKAVLMAGPAPFEWSTNATSSGAYSRTFGYTGASNGHIRVDSDFYGTAVTGNLERSMITSSAINCSGMSTVVLSFQELFTLWQTDTPRVFISNDSVNWTLVHSPTEDLGLQPGGATPNPYYVATNVSTVAANSATVYIRFDWTGDWGYQWFIDDVKLFQPDANEIEVTAANSLFSNGCNLSNAETIGLTFKNAGLNPITSFMAYYSVNGGTPIMENVTLANAVAYDSTGSYTFTATADFTAAGNYDILVWATLTGDTVHGNDSAATTSISANPLTAPYTTSFEVNDWQTPDISGYTWTNEDANNDGFSWGLTSGAANAATDTIFFRTTFNTDATTSADDWLFSPCINAAASTAYLVKFAYKVGIDGNGTVYNEKFSVSYGNDNTSAAMTNLILDAGEVSNDSYANFSAAFLNTNAGILHTGIHVYSDPDKFFFDIDDFSFEALAPPTANFNVNVNGSNATVTDFSNEAITSWSWNWGDATSNSNGPAPGAHTYAAPGTYTVCLTVTNLAGTDSMCKTVNVISGIEELADVSGSITLTPSPASTHLNVHMHNATHGLVQIQVLNLLGETVLTHSTINNETEKLNISDLASGSYFVTLKGDDFRAMKRFVIAK